MLKFECRKVVKRDEVLEVEVISNLGLNGTLFCRKVQSQGSLYQIVDGSKELVHLVKGGFVEAEIRLTPRQTRKIDIRLPKIIKVPNDDGTYFFLVGSGPLRSLVCLCGGFIDLAWVVEDPQNNVIQIEQILQTRVKIDEKVVLPRIISNDIIRYFEDIFTIYSSHISDTTFPVWFITDSKLQAFLSMTSSLLDELIYWTK